MAEPKNPFNPGVPSSPTEFVGRENLIRRLEASIFNTHHQALVSLVGQRRIGKTSLLRKVQNDWTRGDQASCILLDCQEFASLPPRIWLQQILTVLGNDVDPEQQRDVSYLWTLLGSRVRDLDRRLLLILDEFEAFAAQAAAGFDGAFFSRLRSLLISENAANRLTLIVSTRKSLADYDWAEDVVGSPFINIVGHFVSMDLLSNAESHQLLRRGEEFLDDSDRELILRLAGKHPHFLQVGGSEAWHIKRESGESASSPADLRSREDFESTLRRRFREQAELVFRQMLDDMLEEESADLSVRAVLGVGDYRFEKGLRRQLLLDDEGRLLSEGLRAFLVGDSSTVREAIQARFDALPGHAQRELVRAASTGGVIEGPSAEVLRRVGWVGPDGHVREEARAWVPLSMRD